ncbi:hypothetical protein GCM10022224_061140 [Nonomuraea antimicrobica]|uniref:Uncharacterized protein n=1 Tax=Nonomuraea antimicrobica TaxID=561173 RepID=A0ABP7CCY1_9ACTN
MLVLAGGTVVLLAVGGTFGPSGPLGTHGWVASDGSPSEGSGAERRPGGGEAGPGGPSGTGPGKGTGTGAEPGAGSGADGGTGADASAQARAREQGGPEAPDKGRERAEPGAVAGSTAPADVPADVSADALADVPDDALADVLADGPDPGDGADYRADGPSRHTDQRAARYFLTHWGPDDKAMKRLKDIRTVGGYLRIYTDLPESADNSLTAITLCERGLVYLHSRGVANPVVFVQAEFGENGNPVLANILGPADRSCRVTHPAPSPG